MDTRLNIVVVEDHPALRELTVDALREEGHRVIGVECAEEFAEVTDCMRIDLMVIDLNLPGEDGISLARRIRKDQPDIGIIILTASAGARETMLGYESGADIYLTKPISVDVLISAVHALSRRINPAGHAATIIFDMSKLVLSSTLGSIDLTLHESMLLTALIRAQGHRLENWQLIELLSQAETEYSRGTLNVQISRLRKKLTKVCADKQPIKSIRQLGYQLCINVLLV